MNHVQRAQTAANLLISAGSLNGFGWPEKSTHKTIIQTKYTHPRYTVLSRTGLDARIRPEPQKQQQKKKVGAPFIPAVQEGTLYSRNEHNKSELSDM